MKYTGTAAVEVTTMSLYLKSLEGGSPAQLRGRRTPIGPGVLGGCHGLGYALIFSLLDRCRLSLQVAARTETSSTTSASGPRFSSSVTSQPSAAKNGR